MSNENSRKAPTGKALRLFFSVDFFYITLNAVLFAEDFQIVFAFDEHDVGEFACGMVAKARHFFPGADAAPYDRREFGRIKF